MDGSELLRLPATMALLVAGVLLLLALWQLFAGRRRWRQRRRLAATWRMLLLLVFAALTLLFVGTGLAVRGYRLLGAEAPVIAVDARILSPQRWALTLTWPDGSTRAVALAGDDFRIEAVVLKWKLPAILAGAPPLYRLDRLSGRYDSAVQDMEAPRTVVDFGEAGRFDLLDLKKRYPQWLPAVDSVYGSGAYLPLVNRGHYEVSVMRTGALVARPDAATRERIGQAPD
jgi:hypothetical protein